ncbi:MAG TPA: response regulator, partial [Planctomycetota bacterium]|nr:response regulator [Planctomycetota bacterium]
MEYRKFPVLVVDDEVENLDAFTLNFGRKFTIKTASSGKDALELAKTESFAVVIADQRMPGMLGTDFLAEFRKIRPDAVRMILTGYTDLESVIAAINDGQISRYITKPWEARDLESVVKNAIDHYRRGLERRRRYRELTAYNRVLQLISGERSLSRVVKEVLELIALEFGYARTFLLLGDPSGERPLKGQVVLHGADGKPQVKKI